MALIFDPVSYAIDKFLIRCGEDVVDLAFRAALGLSSCIATLGPEVRQRDCETLILTLDQVHTLVTDTCSRNSFGRLLLLFRKVRHELGMPLIQRRFSSSSRDIGTLMEQATIYGTNAILQYAQRDDALAEFGARYTFQPKDEEMSDALQLVVYALVHRQVMFIANTEARRPLGHEVSFVPLIDSYNVRQERRISRRLVDATGNGRILVIPAFVFNIPSHSRITRVELATGESCEIAHRNYIPLIKDFNTAIAQYDYLDNDVFTILWGMEYPKWKTIWAALNCLLRESLISLWTPQLALRVRVEEATAAADRADDYSDTGIGTATRESLIQGCVDVAEYRFFENTCTREDASLFIDGLTLKGPLDDIHFVEQPILFYDVGHGRVIWDYLRHGAVIRAIARKTVTQEGKRKARNSSGPGFEKFITDRLSDAIPDIRDLKSGVAIRDLRKKVWDIDVSFVLDEILFLIEAKHYQKSVKYHAADGSEVSDRIQSWESWCEKLDTKLTKYREKVQQKWEGSTALGAICIVCTEETEFIASADRKYWLNFPDTPRICTIDELIEFLNNGGVKNLFNHQNFSRFVHDI